jgi:hypothetical protein
MPPGQIMQVPVLQGPSGTFPNPAFGVPPGQFKKMPTIPSTSGTTTTTVPNPFFNIAPGHWDDVILPPNFG